MHGSTNGRELGFRATFAGPFVRSLEDARALAAQVGGLFLYGFLERTTDPGDVAVVTAVRAAGRRGAGALPSEASL